MAFVSMVAFADAELLKPQIGLPSRYDDLLDAIRQLAERLHPGNAELGCGCLFFRCVGLQGDLDPLHGRRSVSAGRQGHKFGLQALKVLGKLSRLRLQLIRKRAGAAIGKDMRPNVLRELNSVLHCHFRVSPSPQAAHRIGLRIKADGIPNLFGCPVAVSALSESALELLQAVSSRIEGGCGCLSLALCDLAVDLANGQCGSANGQSCSDKLLITVQPELETAISLDDLHLHPLSRYAARDVALVSKPYRKRRQRQNNRPKSPISQYRPHFARPQLRGNLQLSGARRNWRFSDMHSRGAAEARTVANV